MTSDKLQIYQNNLIMGSSKNQLTLLLYNGAIKYCSQSKLAIEQGKTQDAHNLLIKAQDVVDYLKGSLDKRYPIYSEFDNVYNVINYSLLQANIYKDTNDIAIALELIYGLRDIWKELIS